MTEDEVLCFEDITIEFGRRDGEGVEDDKQLRLIERQLRHVELVSGVVDVDRHGVRIIWKSIEIEKSNLRFIFECLIEPQVLSVSNGITKIENRYRTCQTA